MVGGHKGLIVTGLNWGNMFGRVIRKEGGSLADCSGTDDLLNFQMTKELSG